MIDKKCGIYTVEIDYTKLMAKDIVECKFERVSKYPKSELDFNFIIDRDMLYSAVEKIATSVKCDFSYDVSLLDIFEKEGESTKSYTLHYNIWSNERTLTGEEIENFHKTVIDTFKDNGINLKL